MSGLSGELPPLTTDQRPPNTEPTPVLREAPPGVILLGAMLRERHILAAVTAALVVAASAVQSFGEEIRWRPYKDGMKEARESGLPVMLRIFTTWSGPCREFAENVQGNREVVQLSRRFICIEVDFDKERALCERYGVSAVPTFIFTDPNGRELHRMVGYRPLPWADVAKHFIAEMKIALSKTSRH